MSSSIFSRPKQRGRLWQGVFSLLGLLLVWGGLCAEGRAEPFEADDPRVTEAVRKGVGYLRKTNYSYKPATGLIVYTLLMAGEPKDSPAVKRGLELLEKKFEPETSTYLPGQLRNIYESGVDAMALAKADPEYYSHEIEMIVDYIAAMQKDHGAWFYQTMPDTYGDNSITQYAILGLWAGERAGIQAPAETLGKAAEWLVNSKVQNSDGGYPYHPQSKQHPLHSTGTMSTAASGSLAILSMLLFNAVPEKKAEQAPLKFGLLERAQPGKPVVSRGQYRRLKDPMKLSAGRVEQWIKQNLQKDMQAEHRGMKYYYFYSLERAATLNGWETIDGVDWYRAGVDILLPQQRPTGEWIGFQESLPADTCFALLFLMRSTKQMLPPPQTSPPLGEGLLTGGRGLPDDLAGVEFRDGKVLVEKNPSSFDQLLSGLSEVSIEQGTRPEQAPRKVDVSNPEKLIGRLDDLRPLARHEDPRVRQVAAWALGRTDRLDGVEFLLPLLEDPDLDVAIEARYALCWISRRPNGFGHVPDPRISPTGEENLLDIERKQREWQAALKRDWRKWYLEQRPYELRDDFDDPTQQTFRRKAR